MNTPTSRPSEAPRSPSLRNGATARMLALIAAFSGAAAGCTDLGSNSNPAYLNGNSGDGGSSSEAGSTDNGINVYPPVDVGGFPPVDTGTTIPPAQDTGTPDAGTVDTGIPAGTDAGANVQNACGNNPNVGKNCPIKDPTNPNAQGVVVCIPPIGSQTQGQLKCDTKPQN